jgi:hypothetical protein
MSTRKLKQVQKEFLFKDWAVAKEGETGKE